MGLLFAGAGGGSGTAYGVTKSSLETEVKSLKTIITLKDVNIDNLEKDKKTLQDTITKKDGQIAGLRAGIRDRDADTDNMVKTMQLMTQKTLARNVNDCGYFVKPGKAEFFQNQGRYIDKAGHVKQ